MMTYVFKLTEFQVACFCGQSIIVWHARRRGICSNHCADALVVTGRNLVNWELKGAAIFTLIL